MEAHCISTSQQKRKRKSGRVQFFPFPLHTWDLKVQDLKQIMHWGSHVHTILECKLQYNHWSTKAFVQTDSFLGVYRTAISSLTSEEVKNSAQQHWTWNPCRRDGKLLPQTWLIHRRASGIFKKITDKSLMANEWHVSLSCKKGSWGKSLLPISLINCIMLSWLAGEGLSSHRTNVK